MATKLFPIKDSIGFRAGHLPDGTQVLIGRWGIEAVCIRFSANGEPLGIDAYPINSVSSFPDPEIDQVTTRLEVNLGTIRVSTFSFPDRGIGLRDMPDYLQEFVDSPTTFSPEEAQRLAATVESWNHRQGFVLVWCEDYEMSRDGEIEST